MGIFSINKATRGYTRYFKIMLISTSVLLIAMAIKLSVPVILHFVFFQLPSIYAFLISYLKPPYIYLVGNCIIITVVASYKLQNKGDESPVTDAESEDVKVESDLETDVTTSEAVEVSSNTELFGYEESAVKAIEPLLPEVGYIGLSATVTEMETKKGSEVSEARDEDVAVRTSSTAVPPVRQDSIELLSSSAKPPVSTRFAHRKSVKASPEGGKSLRVTKPKRQDTLESTWKAITEGRSMPLTRHLKKADTWENRQTIEPPEKTIMKSDTFHNPSSLQRAGSGKLKKEPSPSQDDFNRRVEAFINKCNQEMKLQRQESLNQYQEMIKQGGI